MSCGVNPFCSSCDCAMAEGMAAVARAPLATVNIASFRMTSSHHYERPEGYTHVRGRENGGQPLAPLSLVGDRATTHRPRPPRLCEFLDRILAAVHVAVELEHECIGAVRHGFLKPVEMEDAVLKRGTGQAPVHSGSSDRLELLPEGGGPALEPGVRVERHGEARAGPNGCYRSEGRFDLAISSAVRQPDVSRPQGIAELEQDRCFPELTIEAAIPLHAFQPFRPHEGDRHPSRQGSVTRAVKGAENVDCTEERRRGLAAAEGQTVQEAGSISAEASISVSN